MHLSTAVGLVALTGYTFAREMAVDKSTEPLYASGAFMQQIMAKKEVSRENVLQSYTTNKYQATFARQRASGASGNSAQYPRIDNLVECIDGEAVAIPGNANYTFRCDKVRS